MFKYYNNFILYLFLIFFILFFFRDLTVKENFAVKNKMKKKKYITILMKYIKNSNHFEYKLNNSKIEITPSTNQIAYSFKGDKFKLTNISNNSYLFNDVKLFFTITFLYRDSVLFTIKGGGYILYFIQKDDDKNSLIIYDYYEEDKKDKNIVGNIQSKNLKNIKLDYPSFYKLNIYDAFKETINAILIATLIYYNKIYHYDDYPYTSTTNQSSSVTTTIKKINKENKDFKKEEKIKKEKKEKLKKKICES